MSLRSRLINMPLTVVPQTRSLSSDPSLLNARFVGNDITIYPSDNGERYITKGYNMNDGVFSIVSKNAEKAAQVRLFHAKVKRTERKTLEEYNLIQKGALNKFVIKEMGKMRKSMTEDKVADSPLSKLLNKPTRYQTQSEWLEQIIALRELQGEGNIWKNRTDTKKPPLELLVIPKPHLNLVGNRNDPWDVSAYQFVLNGYQFEWKKEDVVMWKYTNPCSINPNLDHMRGLAPLYAAMILLQGMNEGDLRVATSNKNAGAYGFAYRKDAGAQEPSLQQKNDMRNQFDGIINSSEMAGKVAILSGEWGYHNIGVSVEGQKLLEQYGFGFKRLCRVWKTPAGIFDELQGTYDNQKQWGRQWIYSKIAPMVYQFRGILSESLLLDFGLDPTTNLIDCDINSLPELTEDLGELTTALKDAVGLTVDQRLDAMGYEMIGGDEGEARLVPSGYQTLKDLVSPIGGPLPDMNLPNAAAL